MFVYIFGTASGSAPSVLTTNATPNTETDAFTIGAGAGVGVRNVGLLSVQLMGRGSTLSAISGIVMRFLKFGTGSTGGTTQTPAKTDPGMQDPRTASIATRPTAGSTRTNHHISGCGAAGPGGFVAECQEAMMYVQGSAATSIDAMDASGTASLNYDLTVKFTE
jgi:hypothetical protein